MREDEYKDKRGKIQIDRSLVLHEEIIYYFHNSFYIPTFEK